MNLRPTVDRRDPDFDPVLYEHALEHATDDLWRITASLANRYFNAGLAHALSWAVLLEIEEQAFSDLGFQSRNEPAVIGGLPRISAATLPGVDLYGPIDWRIEGPSLPTVYLCVRALSNAQANGRKVESA
ncbi:DUF2471 family protein [Burkholderia sp. MR1-5-21]